MNLKALLNLTGKQIILASASPRRADLLKQVGLDFKVQASDFDEKNESYTIPEVHVLELSYKKTLKVAEKNKEGIIIGADTIVVLQKQILGKPDSPEQAKNMLQQLSGQTHTVYTGFAIIDKPSGRTVSDYEKTEVTFRPLSNLEIEAYIETGNPMDKAGAYGIQDESALFVTSIHGCFYNVVGFPITKFYSTINSFLSQNQIGMSS